MLIIHDIKKKEREITEKIMIIVFAKITETSKVKHCFEFFFYLYYTIVSYFSASIF